MTQPLPPAVPPAPRPMDALRLGVRHRSADPRARAIWRLCLAVAGGSGLVALLSALIGQSDAGAWLVALVAAAVVGFGLALSEDDEGAEPADRGPADPARPALRTQLRTAPRQGGAPPGVGARYISSPQTALSHDG